jgi:hypothetical protein
VATPEEISLLLTARNQLSGIVAEATKSLDPEFVKAAEAAAAAATAHGAAHESATPKIAGHTGEVHKHNEAIKEMTNEARIAVVGLSQLGASYSFLSTALSALRAEQSAGSVLTLLNVSAGIAAAGIAIATVELIRYGAEQQEQSTHVRNMAAATEEAMHGIDDSVNAMIGHTKASLTQMDNALANVAGRWSLYTGGALDAAGATQLLTAANTLALASGESLDASMQALVRTVTVFKVPADQMSDAVNTLYQVSRLTGEPLNSVAQSITMLHTRLGEAAPSLNTTAAIMVALAAHGIDSARGLMQFANAVGAISQPVATNEILLKDLGISLYDANGKAKDAGAVMEDLAGYFVGLSDKQKDQLATMVVGQAGAAQFIEVMDAMSGTLADVVVELSDHDAALKAAGISAEDLTVKHAELLSRFELVAGYLSAELIPGLLAWGDIFEHVGGRIHDGLDEMGLWWAAIKEVIGLHMADSVASVQRLWDKTEGFRGALGGIAASVGTAFAEIGRSIDAGLAIGVAAVKNMLDLLSKIPGAQALAAGTGASDQTDDEKAAFKDTSILFGKTPGVSTSNGGGALRSSADAIAAQHEIEENRRVFANNLAIYTASLKAEDDRWNEEVYRASVAGVNAQIVAENQAKHDAALSAIQHQHEQDLANAAGKGRTPPQGAEPKQTAIEGFEEELTSNASRLEAAYGKLGGATAAALETAVATNTGAAGAAVGRQVQAMAEALEHAGVEDVQPKADELARLMHDALVARTPETVAAAEALIGQYATAIETGLFELKAKAAETKLTDALELTATDLAEKIQTTYAKAGTAITAAMAEMEKTTHLADAKLTVDELTKAYTENVTAVEMLAKQSEAADDRVVASHEAAVDRVTARTFAAADLAQSRQEAQEDRSRGRAQSAADAAISHSERVADAQTAHAQRVAAIQSSGGTDAAQAAQLAAEAKSFAQQEQQAQLQESRQDAARSRSQAREDQAAALAITRENARNAEQQRRENAATSLADLRADTAAAKAQDRADTAWADANAKAAGTAAYKLSLEESFQISAGQLAQAAYAAKLQNIRDAAEEQVAAEEYAADKKREAELKAAIKTIADEQVLHPHADPDALAKYDYLKDQLAAVQGSGSSDALAAAQQRGLATYAEQLEVTAHIRENFDALAATAVPKAQAAADAAFAKAKADSAAMLANVLAATGALATVGGSTPAAAGAGGGAPNFTGYNTPVQVGGAGAHGAFEGVGSAYGQLLAARQVQRAQGDEVQNAAGDVIDVGAWIRAHSGPPGATSPAAASGPQIAGGGDALTTGGVKPAAATAEPARPLSTADLPALTAAIVAALRQVPITLDGQNIVDHVTDQVLNGSGGARSMAGAGVSR